MAIRPLDTFVNRTWIHVASRQPRKTMIDSFTSRELSRRASRELRDRLIVSRSSGTIQNTFCSGCESSEVNLSLLKDYAHFLSYVPVFLIPNSLQPPNSIPHSSSHHILLNCSQKKNPNSSTFPPHPFFPALPKPPLPHSLTPPPPPTHLPPHPPSPHPHLHPQNPRTTLPPATLISIPPTHPLPLLINPQTPPPPAHPIFVPKPLYTSPPPCQ